RRRKRRLQPNTRQALDPRCLEPERRQRANQGLLEVAAVLLDVLPVPGQIEDRVADELPRAVVRRLATAIGLDDLDLRVLRNMQLARLGSPPERYNRRMLQQDDRVRERALRDGRRKRALQLP